MQDVTALHLQICTEWDKSYSNNQPDMYAFWPHLRSRWLEPISEQLETLTLYWDTRWGLFPPMDLSGLHFPKLKSLSLGTYVFGQDEQLEWLLSHKTLEYLSLDTCAICSVWAVPTVSEGIYTWQDHLQFAQANHTVPDEKEPKHGYGYGVKDSDQIFRYHGTWPAYFDRIAKELPLLRDFRFDHRWDPWGEEYGETRDTRFEDRFELEAAVGIERYVFFRPGFEDGEWDDIDPSYAYGRGGDPSLGSDEAEQKALDHLLEVVRERNDMCILSEGSSSEDN